MNVYFSSMSERVSALIALAGKFPPHVSRAPFVTLLVSAWAFLFVSAVSFNGAIAQLIIVNSHVFKSWTKLLESYNAQIVGLSLSKLSNALTGTVRIEEKDHNVKELFSDFAGKIREAGQMAFEERQKIHDAAPASLQAPLLRYVRIAHFSMRLGFVLLCIAAIKGFLAV